MSKFLFAVSRTQRILLLAAAYVAGSVIVAIGALFVGLWLARRSFA